MLPLAIKPQVWSHLPVISRERLARLEAWDLSAIEARLERLLGWSPCRVGEVASEYRRFLGLSILEDRRSHGVSESVDAFWHEHLLDTLNYHALCSEVIGKFVHHLPSSIPNEYDDRYAATLGKLRHFYVDCSDDVWSSGAAQCGNCRDIATELEAFAS